MCTAPFIDLIIKAGIDSLKIEGRAKTFYYVASTTAAYRKAVDAFLADPEHFMCPERVLDELTRTSHRHYSTGFYFGPEGAKQDTKHGEYVREWELVGIVDSWDDGVALCTQRGKFVLGNALEALTPSGECITFTPEFIWDKDSELIESTPHSMMEFSVPCEVELPQYSILRCKIQA